MSHPLPEARDAPARDEAESTHRCWPILMLVAASGAVVVSLGMTAARRSADYADLLYWMGLLIIFMPIAARLATASASRIERVILLVGLGLWLYMVKILHSPTAFTFYDELLHSRTATDILLTGWLFGENPLLPVSPYYPGLENAALVFAQFVGLPLYVAATFVLAIARILSILALFMLYEELAGSHRLAGLATLIYVTNPAFLYFDKQFAYESLGLPLALFLFWIEARRQRNPDRSPYSLAGLGGLILASIIVTHHLSSYALSTFLAVWSLVWLWLRRQRGVQVKTGPLWLTAAAILGTVTWLLVVAQVTIPYLGGNLLATLREVVSLIAGETVIRRLFHGFGDVAPLWERLVSYGAVLGVMALLPAGLLAIWRRYREDSLALTMGLGAMTYPVTQVLRFTPFGLQLSGRTPEFIFLPLGFVLATALLDSDSAIRWHQKSWGRLGGGWLASPQHAVTLRQGTFVLWITVLFMGGVILGWPRWGRMPGPYLVVADSRSIETQGLVTALWARQQLEPKQRFAADRINAVLLLAYGRQDPVTASYDAANVPELFFADGLRAGERAIIRQGAIRYIVIDERLTIDRPLAGFYFEPGERSPDEITVQVGMPLARELEQLPNAHRVMDSGDIVIYDVGAIADER